MTNPVPCPLLCGRNVSASAVGTRDSYSYDCPTCGKYTMTKQALAKANSLSPRDKAKVSAYTKERDIHQRPEITIVSEHMRTQSDPRPLVSIEEILKTGFPQTISDRLDRSLRNIHRLSDYPGEVYQCSIGEDYPIFFAENEQSFRFVMDALKDAGWIDVKLEPAKMSKINLTVKGWNRIAELERVRVGAESNQVFVAMWFEPSLERPYTEGIEKAIEATHYKAVRIDLKEHNEKICDAIIGEIRKSRFMVADFTGHRGGVYFEAGYALGLGLPIIWTCRENDKDDLHFDTRQYNHIFWKDETDLFEKLRRRIEATIS